MIENILANLKIERLNPMQEASINAWKEGKDLILLSPTGSGKTLAYLLPLVQSLKPGITGVQAIVLVPSRELALQIDQVFKSMNTPFKAVSCYGGRPAMEEHRTIKGVQPSVIIGTPGRMNDHLSKQNFDADTVTTLVIDEFDKCLEFGFQEEMATVIGQLPNLQRRFLWQISRNRLPGLCIRHSLQSKCSYKSGRLYPLLCHGTFCYGLFQHTACLPSL